MSTQNWGVPGGSDVKNVPAMQETRVQSREQLPTPVFLPGEFHRQRSLTGYSPWGNKESDMTFDLKAINRIQQKTFSRKSGHVCFCLYQDQDTPVNFELSSTMILT